MSPDALGRIKTGLFRAVGALLFLLASVGVWTLVRAGASLPASEPDTSSVARAWNQTISRLGIEPVFPPDEDVHVGDVYAVVTGGDTAFLGRAIKLTHLDMSEALTATYSKLPIFPKTAKRPDRDGEPWEAIPSEGRLFEAGQRNTLSLVAFPSFSVRRVRGAEAGVTTGGGWLGGLFGTGRNRQEVEEIRIPVAETYGVGALFAAGQLAAFCNGPLAAICTETGIRNALSMTVGNDIWKRKVDAKTGRETNEFILDVELALINRVYLTRSIEHLRSSDDAHAVMASIAARLNDALNRSPAIPGASNRPDADASRSREMADSDRAAARAALEEQRNRVEAIVADISAALPGGMVNVAMADNRQVALKQTFFRPVAIGFRAVRWVPQPSSVPGLKSPARSATDDTVGMTDGRSGAASPLPSSTNK